MSALKEGAFCFLSPPHPAIIGGDAEHSRRPAGKKVWDRVRNQQLGYKIRRQYPIGHFITDFYCAPAKLVIEIDGDTHAEPDQAAYDAARTAWLEAQGYRVIRFQNNDVHHNLEPVLDAIRVACERNWGHSSKWGG